EHDALHGIDRNQHCRGSITGIFRAAQGKQLHAGITEHANSQYEQRDQDLDQADAALPESTAMTDHQHPQSVVVTRPSGDTSTLRPRPSIHSSKTAAPELTKPV